MAAPQRVAAVVVLALPGVALALGACRQVSTAPAPPLAPPPRPRAGPGVILPDGGMSHAEPLALLRWNDSGALLACGSSRVDTEGGEKVLPGRCLIAARGREAQAASASATGSFPRESGRPPGPCRVHYEDVPGDPGAPAARATLVGPAGRQLLDEWKPPAEVDGDYFAVEIAFSPDGEHVGVVHSSVGLGVGERLVRVVAAEVRPAPRCR